MAAALDLVLGRAVGPDRGRVLSELRDWVAATFRHVARDAGLFERAVTHGSLADPSYERLEFLGDRVLGLCIAEWLFELFPDEPEGQLTRRLHHLVSGAVCADVARAIGAGDRLRFNEQAYHDGVKASEYVLGDVVEALLGALYLDAGIDAARAWVRRAWAARITDVETARAHPKAALQEWALANRRGMPTYAVIEESGPDHAKRHTVAVTLGDRTRSAAGSTKREAETEAARLLLADLTADQPVKRRRAPRAIARTRPRG